MILRTETFILVVLLALFGAGFAWGAMYVIAGAPDFVAYQEAALEGSIANE